MNFQQHITLAADSDAPLQWLVSLIPYIALTLAVVIIFVAIVSKVWIFPAPATRQARNRRKTRGRSR